MATRLKVGRPAKGSDSVARQAIVEKTLEAIRIRPAFDIQRKNLAAVADVTPALISYYFPDKWDLIHTACFPIITNYVGELEHIARTIEPKLSELLALIKLYVNFNISNETVLDFYMSSLRQLRREHELAKFSSVYQEVIKFMVRLMAYKQLKQMNPVMLQSALWALSKYSAGSYQSIPHFLSPEYDSDPNGLAQAIFDLVVGGAGEHAGL